MLLSLVQSHPFAAVGLLVPLPLATLALAVTTARGAIGLGSPTFDKAIDGGVSTSDVLRVVP